ncbi:MAG: uroporphyrinogen decarboxylase family protein [Dehalococcoidia bacterium]|jgi:uroporphyrinogen decarboxylase
MTKKERIKAVLEGKEVDRVPVGFWRHWPQEDQQPEALAAAALAFQKLYDLDFIKVPVASTFCVDDYGVKHAWRGSPMGDRDYLEYAIKKIEDWDRIEPLDVKKGTYGRMLQALQIIVEKKDKDTPVIFTIFNPINSAYYLAGDETCLVHLRREPDRVERGIKALTETCVRFVRAVMEEGCDGIFLSARAASFDLMSTEEYFHYGRPGDQRVLEAAASGWFNVMHLHGKNPMFKELADYPVHAMNWHDRTAWPGLDEAGKIFKGALMGGIEQFKTLLTGRTDDIKKQADDAIKQMNGRRLILAPGCTYPITVPHINLMALRKSVGR